jgi:hypothetical protein
VSGPARERLRALPRSVLQALRAELGPCFVNEQQRAFFDSEPPWESWRLPSFELGRCGCC